MPDDGTPGKIIEEADRTVIGMAGTDGPTTSDQVHLLVRQEGDGGRQHIELGEQPVTLGRSPAADVLLQDTQVSKLHCQVRLVGREACVTDLGSTNGTLIEGRRLAGEALLPVGARLRVGGFTFVHELRFRREVAKARELENDLRKAREYVEALLPPPRREPPMRTHWCFVPCSILGGDAFGYHRLDDDRHAIYLLDVCGHGAGAAMHSVAAINVLRQHGLPGVDFSRPDEVLGALNKAYDMDQHGGMYFTAWYGVYDRAARRLTYASAGHPPALLVGPDHREARPLQTRSLPVGTAPGLRYTTLETPVAPGSRLYLFSDGVYEIVTREGREWSLAGFQEIILRGSPDAGGDEAARLRRAVEDVSGSTEFADDFSLLVAELD
ncbi:MAG: PP2C family protein-serine/threonine phosphatase [Limisphaerales bacterium]